MKKKLSRSTMKEALVFFNLLTVINAKYENETKGK